MGCCSYTGRGSFFFNLKNLSHQDMLSVCSAVAFKKRMDRLSRGTWNTAAPIFKGKDMPRKPLYCLFNSLLYCAREQQPRPLPCATP